MGAVAIETDVVRGVAKPARESRLVRELKKEQLAAWAYREDAARRAHAEGLFVRLLTLLTTARIAVSAIEATFKKLAARAVKVRLGAGTVGIDPVLRRVQRLELPLEHVREFLAWSTSEASLEELAARCRSGEFLDEASIHAEEAADELEVLQMLVECLPLPSRPVLEGGRAELVRRARDAASRLREIATKLYVLTGDDMNMAEHKAACQPRS